MEKGYAGTSMSGLLATLGGSKATLWGYFRSKEELFAAVLDDATAAYRRELAQCLEPSGDLAEGLTGFCRSFLHRILSPDALALWRLVAAESARLPQVGAIFYERAAATTERALSAFLSEHMDMGELRREDPTRAARVVISLCTGHQHRLLWGIEQPTPERIEVEAAAAASIFLRAYAPLHATTASPETTSPGSPSRPSSASGPRDDIGGSELRRQTVRAAS